MKTYYLRLTEADFTQDGNTWTSSTVDLYDAASDEYVLSTPGYTNYSAVKSEFGTNLLGNNVWTGLEDASPDTESGYVDGERFIDTTGRIDLVNYEFTISNIPGDVDVQCTLDVYTIDDPEADFPAEWASKLGITPARPIFVIKSYRYAKFVLNLVSNQDLHDSNVEILIKVNIGPPVMTPLYDRTGVILNMFPEWMGIREIDNEPATPELATPTSLGGQFINAVAGEWLDDLTAELKYQRLQQYISTANEDQPTWIYGAFDVPDHVWDIQGDDETLINTVSQQDFYKLTADEHGYWWDQSRNAIYTNHEYTTLTVNGVEYEQTPVHVWNWFDEFGLVVDLRRLYMEPNRNFKHRILDVYQNKPGVGIEAFKLALRRELDLWRLEYATPNTDYYSLGDNAATPTSDFEGATPEVIEIFDMPEHSDFTDPEGMPTEKFKHVVDYLANRYPVTWGYFKWDNAIWDVGGAKHEGFSLLPYRYDAESLPDEDVQAGIGDINDLYIFRPDAITGPREFNARFKVRGRQRQYRTEYPAVNFEVNVYGRADKDIYNNPEATTWVTVEVVSNDATPTTYYYEQEVTVTSDADNENPTGTANGYETVLFATEGRTRPDITWFDNTLTQYNYTNDNELNVEIDSVTVRFGRINPVPATPSWSTFPIDDIDMWLTDDDATTINSADAATAELNGTLAEGFVLKSNEIASAVGKWTSEPQRLVVSLNGANPNNAINNIVIPAPDILWDDYLEVVPNKEYVIEFMSVDDTGNAAAYTRAADGTDFYLGVQYIYVNSGNGWVADKLYFDADIVTEFEFSTGEAATPAYPISAPYWTLFENQQIGTIYGVVDENGPWRNNQKQAPGNTNFHLEQVELTRDDFGVPNSEDYIVTWIGVEADDSRVLAWIDSNTIRPVVEDTTIEYPADAIQEVYDEDSSTYYFDAFVLRARLRPGIEPQWYPHIHSGYFYEDNQEYYLYAESEMETATATTRILNTVARQGAPIIANTSDATPYRQVAFYDDDTQTLTLTNTETVTGNGTNYLYASYNNIYDITVTNLDNMQPILCDVETSSNEIWTAYETSYDKEYEITYKLRHSLYADHDYVHTDDTQRTKVVFDQVTLATINYETARYNPATPIDIPLNAFYTTIDESFIYISHDEYDLSEIEIRLSPAHIVADGEDYAYVSMRSIDTWGNPKPNESFTLTTDFGTFAESGTNSVYITTDVDGFAVVTLISEDTTASLTGTVTITGAATPYDARFSISPVEVRPYILMAKPTADAVPADGESLVAVHGRLLDDVYSPVSHATVMYRRARSHSELFNMAYNEVFQPAPASPPVWADAGLVLTDNEGRFIVGPFEAATPYDPGYWFLAAESDEADANYATPSTYDITGDVAFWVEYPDNTYGVDKLNALQAPFVQYSTRPEDVVEMSTINAFPVYYDDATPIADATPVTPEWMPPEWYAIPKYRQYQLGLLGTSYYEVDIADLLNSHPDYKDY